MSRDRTARPAPVGVRVRSASSSVATRARRIPLISRSCAVPNIRSGRSAARSGTTSSQGQRDFACQQQLGSPPAENRFATLDAPTVGRCLERTNGGPRRWGVGTGRRNAWRRMFRRARGTSPLHGRNRSGRVATEPEVLRLHEPSRPVVAQMGAGSAVRLVVPESSVRRSSGEAVFEHLGEEPWVGSLGTLHLVGHIGREADVKSHGPGVPHRRFIPSGSAGGRGAEPARPRWPAASVSGGRVGTIRSRTGIHKREPRRVRQAPGPTDKCS